MLIVAPGTRVGDVAGPASTPFQRHAHIVDGIAGQFIGTVNVAGARNTGNVRIANVVVFVARFGLSVAWPRSILTRIVRTGFFAVAE